MAGSAGLRAMERKLGDVDSSLPISPVTPDKGKGVVHHGMKERSARREETKTKRYMPSVIQGGRPAKTLKHATETPRPAVTPAAGEANRKKGISPCDTCVAACSNRHARLARRSLNFDLVSKDTGSENQECQVTCSLPVKLGVVDGKKPLLFNVYRRERSRKGLYDHDRNSTPSGEKGPTCAVLSPPLAGIAKDKIHEPYVPDIESLGECSCSRVTLPFDDPIDGSNLDQNLPLGTADHQLSRTLRSRNDSPVPNKHTSKRKKKRGARPRVHLDEETIRTWNFLMGAEENEGVGGFDAHNKMEKERERFLKHVKLFIARMHPVQGNRSFSQWKGSVVDSVVGAFLSQNVLDHQSSSAFMSLAAKFPLKFGEKKVKVKTGKKFVGKKTSCKFASKEKSRDRRDSLDWEAVKHASISEVAKTIESRGMNNKLAKRIKGFLVRLAKDHESIDLEWLRDVPVSKAKYGEYTERMNPEELEQGKGWLNDTFHLIRCEDDCLPSINWVLNLAKASVLRYGVCGLVIDPYNELDHQRPPKQTETEYVSQMLTMIKRFAQHHSCHVWFVAHPKQLQQWGGGPPNLYDISGSAHFINKCDNGIVIHRNRDANVGPLDRVQVCVRKVRNKVVGGIGDALLTYNRITGEFMDHE